MPALPDASSVVRFGPYEADLQSGELRKNGTTVRLQQKPFQLLTVLLGNPGRLVTREELRRRLWAADTFVDFDNSLNTAITKLREGLKDPADEHRYVETLARRGYRFVAPVESFRADSPNAAERLHLVLSANGSEAATVDAPREQAVEEAPLGNIRIRSATPARLMYTETGRTRRWLIPGIVGLMMVAGVVGWFLTRPSAKARARLSRRTTLAVLPFRNLTNDPSLDYLSTALPDEIITTLGHAPSLSLRPFSMSQWFTGNSSDPLQAGQQLRVTNVITGHFLRRADRLGVTLEGMDVSTAEVIWRASVEVAMKDLLGMRQQVNSVLEKELLPVLGVPNVELSVTKPQDEEAYQLYLRSQGGSYWNTASNKDGIALLERSIALDAGYAPAWLALGEHYYVEATIVAGSEEPYKKGMSAFEKARQLDHHLLKASTELIADRLFYGGDLGVAFSQIQQLAQEQPRRPEVHLLLAEAFRVAGALDQAARECDITHQLDPEFWTDCFVLYVHTGNFTKAREEIEHTPGNFSSFMLGQVLLREGKVEEALPKLKLLSAGQPYELIHNCWPDSSSRACDEIANKLASSSRSIPDADAWYFGAAMFAFLGKKDIAVRLLDADSKHSFCIYPSVDRDPLFDKIRESDEFKAARQAGIDCQQKFAPYAKLQIQ